MPTIQEVRQRFPQYNDLSDEQLLTGVRNKFYSDIPLEDFMSRFSNEPQRPQPSGGGSALGTALGSVVSGGGGLLSSVGAVGGMVLPGVGFDNALTRAGRDVQQYGESLMSEEMRAKRAALSEAVKQAEEQGLVAEASAALRTLAQNPSLIGSMLLEQIPMFVATGGVGRAAMGAVQLGTRGAVRAAAAGAERQAAAEAASQLAGRVGTGTAIGAGAAIQGGEVAGQAYQDVMSLPDATLANSPAYQALTQRMSGEEARRTLAEEAAQQAGLMGGGISAAAAAALPGAEKALFSKQLSERVVRRVLTGAAGEAAQEAIEEGGGQIAQNIAARRADVERDLTRGAAGAAAIGGTLGAIMGGGIAGVRGGAAPPATEQLPEGLRQAVNEYVANREPVAGQLLIEGREPTVATPIGEMTRTQLGQVMEQRLPAMMEADPTLASRISYARNDQERLAVFEEALTQERNRIIQSRQETEVGRYQEEEATRETQAQIARTEQQISVFNEALTDAERRRSQIEAAPRVDDAALAAVQDEIAQINMAIEGRQRVLSDLAAQEEKTEAPTVSRETEPKSEQELAREAFEIARARQDRLRQREEAPGLEIPSGARVPDTIPAQRDDLRPGAPEITEQRYILNPEYDRRGRLIGGEEVVDIGEADRFGNVLAYVQRKRGNITETVPVETTMDKLAAIPVRETARMTQDIKDVSGNLLSSSGASDVPPVSRRSIGPTRGSEFSARGTEQPQASTAQPTGVQPSGQEARAARRVAAQDKINKLYLDNLKTGGRSGRLLRNALIEALKNNSLNADQVYAAFVAADKFGPLLPAKADHRIQFVAQLLGGDDAANALAASGGVKGQEVQGFRIRPEQPGLMGLIQISLSPAQSKFLLQSGYHEAFHVLQDYFAKYDPKFAEMMRTGFKETMNIKDVDPSIRRKLESVRSPSTGMSYWDELTRSLPGNISGREAQAYVFGALYDAKKRGVPMTGLKPAMSRFINAISNFFSGFGRALRGNGYRNVADIFESVTPERVKAFSESETPTQAEFGQGALREFSARGAEPVLLRDINQLIEDAKSQSNWRDWYNRHEAKVNELFGDDAPIFKKILSATSQAASVPANVTLAIKAYKQLLNGEPFTGYLPAVIQNLERIRSAEGLRGRKISQYGQAVTADEAAAAQAVAVDRHIARLLFGVDVPTRRQVEVATQLITDIANRLGWEPRQVQAALWAFNQVRTGTDPNNVKSYDFYLNKRAEEIRAFRSSFSGAEGRSVQPSARVAERVGETQAAPLSDATIEFSARQTNMSVPEFKTWWEGGWRGAGYTPTQSAARTREGQPIRYYHGTQKQFSRFGKARSGSTEGQEGPFFFSPEPDFSNVYAEMALYAGAKDTQVESGQRMLPVFLSVQNPFDSTLPEFQGQLLDYVDKGLDDGSLTWRDLGTSSKALSGETEAQTTRRKYSLFKRILTLEGVDNWKSMESNAAQKFLRENGFDGFFIIENGVQNLAVFDPRQIKSIFNQFAEGAATQPEFAARQSPLINDPNYSFYMDALTSQPIARSGLFGGVFRRFVGAMDNTSLYGAPNTPERLRDALVRTSVNRNHPIWMLQQLAERQGVLNGRDIGIAAESALMNTGRIEILTQIAGLKFDPTTGDIEIRDDVKPLMEIFKGQVDTKNQAILQRYLIALREKDLRGVGRTGMRSIKGQPFTDQMINDIIQQTEQAHPEFVDIARDLKKFSDSLLDFAVDTGIMTRAKARELALIFYTPFYREMEADSQTDPNQILGPNVNNVLRNTTSALDKKLGGGDGNVGDLLENILRNADSILRAGLKNHALKMTAEVARDVGLGQVVQSPAGGDTVTYRVNGNEVHFRVDDPILFTAMATAPAKTRGALHQVMARMASFFREMITLAPSFMWANLYRGKFQAYAQEGASFSPFTTIKGMKDFLKANPSYLAFTAQTGFGGYTFGMGEKNIAAKMKKQLDDRGIFREVMRLNLAAPFRKAMDGLSKISEATELAERLTLYEKLKAQGMTDKQAAFQAYMLAPFSRQGSGQGVFGNVVQSLIPLVPFLNAKIQGLYRLVENEKGNKTILKIPQQIFLRSMIITAFSTALYGLALSGGYEDELNGLSVDDIVRYDWIFTPNGGKFALPRNFEIGSFFGAVPILAMEAYRKGHTGDLTKAAVSIGTSTLFFNPIPQGVLPILSAVTNYDFFRDRELENYAMRNLPAQDRVDRSTTTIARLASAATGYLMSPLGKEAVSPIKMQAVLNGYLGSIGSGMMTGFDTILSRFDVIPNKPAGPFGDPTDIPAILGNMSGLGRFYRTDETKVSRFVGDFYELKEKATQVSNAIAEASRTGNFERMIELQTEKGQLAGMNRMIGRASTQLSELNRQIRMIEAGQFDSETKLALIAPLRQQRDMIARQTVQQARAVGAI